MSEQEVLTSVDVAAVIFRKVNAANIISIVVKGREQLCNVSC